jgi:hypothetical protein
MVNLLLLLLHLFPGGEIGVPRSLENAVSAGARPAGAANSLTMKGLNGMTTENDKTPEFENTIVGGLFAIAEGLHAVADAIEAQSFSPEHEQIEQVIATLFKIAENGSL